MTTAAAASSSRQNFEESLLPQMKLDNWESIEYWCRIFPWVRKYIPDEEYYRMQKENQERLRNILENKLQQRRLEILKIKEEWETTKRMKK